VTFRQFKVIQCHRFWCQSKAACDFLLVRNSNLGPILQRFGDIAGFLCSWPPPLFHPNFGGVSITPDRRYWGQPASRGLRLFGREIIFDIFQPVLKSYLSVTDRQTT